VLLLITGFTEKRFYFKNSVALWHIKIRKTIECVAKLRIMETSFHPFNGLAAITLGFATHSSFAILPTYPINQSIMALLKYDKTHIMTVY